MFRFCIFLVGVTMNGHKKDLNERFNNNDDSLGRNYRLHVGNMEKRWATNNWG